MGQMGPVAVARDQKLAPPSRIPPSKPSMQASEPSSARADLYRSAERGQSSTLVLDVAAAATILLITLPLSYTRIMATQACPCSTADAAASQTGTCIGWLRPWLVASFPCGQSKLQQLLWWTQHWLPANLSIVVEGGDWDGAWVQLGVASLLAVAAGRGGTAKYQWYRAVVIIATRLGLVLLALLGMAVNTWVAPGALPLAGVHFDCSTMWGATRLLWATQLHPVPGRHKRWLAPIEFLGITACALVARSSHPNPASVPAVLLQLLLVGGLIPTCLSLYTRRSKRLASRRHAPAAHASQLLTLASSQQVSAARQTAPAWLPLAADVPAGQCCSSEGHPGAAARPLCPQPTSPCAGFSTSCSKTTARSICRSTHSKQILLHLPHSTAAPCTAVTAVGHNTPAVLAKMPVYHSRVTTRLVSIKVRNPAAELHTDPSPLVSAVKAAVADAVQPGSALLSIDHAVFRGCIQLVAWVRSVAQQSDFSAAGGAADSRSAAEIQSAAEDAAWHLLGGEEGAYSSVAVSPAVDSGMGTGSGQGWCWVDWDSGGDSLPGVEESQQFGSAQPAVVVRMAGEGLVGWVQANGGSVRVVVVGDEDGAVLADAKVQGRTGFWHGLELGAVGLSATILSFRVSIDLPTTASTTHVSSARLVILPVDDHCGEVLWSTPLLLGLPPVVATQLHQLHATMANYLLEDSSPGSWSIDLQPAEALGQAYEQHIVPLLHDILVCCQPAHAAALHDDMAQQQLARQQVIDDVVGFFEGCGPSMSATLEWLHGCLQLPATEAAFVVQATVAPANILVTLATPMVEHIASTNIEPDIPASTPVSTSPMSTGRSIGHHTSPGTSPSASSQEGSSLPNERPCPSTSTGTTSPATDGVRSSSSSLHTEPPCPSTPPNMRASPSATARLASSPNHPTSAPTPPPIQEHPLPAALAGSSCNPSTEARYQQHPTHRIATTDATLAPLQLPLHAAASVKASLANAIITGSHFLGRLLLGHDRSPSSRRVAVQAIMALVVLHFLCFSLLAKFPEVFIEVWHRKPWMPICIYGVFHLAGHQAGFVPTAAVATVLALQFTFVLQPYFTTSQLVVRIVPLMVLPSTIGFIFDMARRKRFLATSENHTCTKTAINGMR